MSMVDMAIIRVLFLCLWLLIATPTPVNAQAETRQDLTVDMLQERTSHLAQQEGRATIDLSNLIIDLTSAKGELSQYFYREINNTVSRASNPINLNFDNSIIRGDLQLNRLGIASSVGEGALSSLFTALEQEKIARFYPLQTDTAPVIPRVNIFRGSLYFNNTEFTGSVDGANSMYLQLLTARNSSNRSTIDFSDSIFAKEINFSESVFSESISFNRAHFFSKANFDAAEFQNIADFSNSQFEGGSSFEQALFIQIANFNRCVFMETANLSQAIFRDRLILAKSKFLAPLLLTNSDLEKNVTFRDIYLSSQIGLQDAHILNRLDFSNAFLSPQASINVSGLAFDAAESQIVGQPGTIGHYLKLNRLQGNETVFRNLIRNFRNLEQTSDANQIEYEQKQLELQAVGDRLTKISWHQIFTWSWISLVPTWLSLNLLLLLGDYGTNISLIFSIGIIAITLFGLLFWLIDRYRPNINQPIIPSRCETTVMLSSYVLANILSTIDIFVTTNQPFLTLTAIAFVVLPVPIAIASLIYRQGRYHQLLDVSYFVENGEFREFRLLIGRLPIMPRFPFFRDRFMPLLWEKRWNWLNYYDFSLNNIFKLGFNDIRLRDRHLPGLISALVWYQWCLGVLYIVLLLWTLSRTIPGLNLLIYF